MINRDGFEHNLDVSGIWIGPKDLKLYEEILPGFSERYLSLVEQEAHHRQTLQAALAKADIAALRMQFKEARIGQIFGLAIGMIALFCGTFTAVEGSSLAGGFIGAGGVVALVAVFIYGNRKEHYSASGEKIDSLIKD